MIDTPGHGAAVTPAAEPKFAFIAQDDPSAIEAYAQQAGNSIEQVHLDTAIATNKLAVAQWILDNTTLDPNHYDGTQPTPIARCIKSMPSIFEVAPKEVEQAYNALRNFIEQYGINLRLGTENGHDFESLFKEKYSVEEQEIIQPDRTDGRWIRELNEVSDSHESMGTIIGMIIQQEAYCDIYERDMVDISSPMLRTLSVLGKDPCAELNPLDWEGYEEEALALVDSAPNWLRHQLEQQWEAQRERRDALRPVDPPQWEVEQTTPQGRIAEQTHKGTGK